MLQTEQKHNKKGSRPKSLVMEAPGNLFYLINNNVHVIYYQSFKQPVSLHSWYGLKALQQLSKKCSK